MEPSWEVEKYGTDHMTKMAAMPIYGKKPLKIFFSRTKSPIILKLGMKHWEHNDDPVLTLIYFTARSNWVTSTFEWGKLLQSKCIYLMDKNLQQRTYILTD